MIVRSAWLLSSWKLCGSVTVTAELAPRERREDDRPLRLALELLEALRLVTGYGGALAADLRRQVLGPDRLAVGGHHHPLHHVPELAHVVPAPVVGNQGLPGLARELPRQHAEPPAGVLRSEERRVRHVLPALAERRRSEEHTSELQSPYV